MHAKSSHSFARPLVDSQWRDTVARAKSPLARRIQTTLPNDSPPYTWLGEQQFAWEINVFAIGKHLFSPSHCASLPSEATKSRGFARKQLFSPSQFALCMFGPCENKFLPGESSFPLAKQSPFFFALANGPKLSFR